MASSFICTVGARVESSKLVKSWKGASDGVRRGGGGEREALNGGRSRKGRISKVF